MKKIIGLIEYDDGGVFIRTPVNIYFEECLEDAKSVYEFTFDEHDEFVKLKKITKNQVKRARNDDK
jgi:hypothetical protein